LLRGSRRIECSIVTHSPHLRAGVRLDEAAHRTAGLNVIHCNSITEVSVYAEAFVDTMARQMNLLQYLQNCSILFGCFHLDFEPLDGRIASLAEMIIPFSIP